MEDLIMAIRLVSPVIRNVAFGSGLATVSGIGAIDFVHRWPVAITLPLTNPIDVAFAAISVILSSPLLVGIIIGVGLLIGVMSCQWLTDRPDGLQTPE